MALVFGCIRRPSAAHRLCAISKMPEHGGRSAAAKAGEGDRGSLKRLALSAIDELY
jgi:hypothetical protein